MKIGQKLFGVVWSEHACRVYYEETVVDIKGQGDDKRKLTAVA